MGEQIKYDPVTGKPIHEDFYTQPGNKLDQLASGFWDQVSLINSNQLKDVLQSKLTNLSQIQKDQQALNDQVQLFRQQRAQQKLQNDAYWLSVAQKVNPNFKSLQDVMDWQKANGLVVDGKFGKNSLAKWKENELNHTEPQIFAPKDDTKNSEAVYNKQKYIKDNEPKTVTNITNVGTEDRPGSWMRKTAKVFEGATGLGKGLNSMFNTLAEWRENGWLQKPDVRQPLYLQPGRTTAGIYEKGGSFKYQQGGTMNEQEQIIRQVIQDINQGDPQIMQTLASLDKQQQQAILQSIAQLAQQGDQEAANAINRLQNPNKSKLGSKLNYIKRLKGACPEGEELQYYKEGGMIKAKCGCKTLKAQGGDTLTVKKQNPVQEFKSKKKKLDPTTTKTLPNGKYPENWTAADRAKWEEVHGNHGDIPEDFDANGGHKGEKWTPKKACGSKMKKN